MDKYDVASRLNKLSTDLVALTEKTMREIPPGDLNAEQGKGLLNLFTALSTLNTVALSDMQAEIALQLGKPPVVSENGTVASLETAQAPDADQTPDDNGRPRRNR